MISRSEATFAPKAARHRPHRIEERTTQLSLTMTIWYSYSTCRSLSILCYTVRGVGSDARGGWPCRCRASLVNGQRSAGKWPLYLLGAFCWMLNVPELERP